MGTTESEVEALLGDDPVEPLPVGTEEDPPGTIGGMELAEPGENEATFDLGPDGVSRRTSADEVESLLGEPEPGTTEADVEALLAEDEPSRALLSAIASARKADPERAAEVYRISKANNVPSYVVNERLELWKEQDEARSLDPFHYEKTHPGKTYLMLKNPELAPIVLHDEGFDIFEKAANTYLDFAKWFTEVGASGRAGIFDAKRLGGGEGLATKTHEQGLAEIEAAKSKGPRFVEQIDDYESRLVRSGDALDQASIPFRRFEEKRGQMQVAALQAELLDLELAAMAREAAGGAGRDVHEETKDAERRGALRERIRTEMVASMPRYYGEAETGFTAFASKAMGGAASFASVLEGGMAGAVTGTATGAVAGALAGPLAVPGAVLGFGAGGAAGMALATFNMERGGLFWDLMQNGVPVREAAAFSLMYGVGATGVEFAAGMTPQFMRAIGAFKSNPSFLARDQGWKSIATRFLKEYSKGVAGEPLEEVVQTGLEQMTSYAARWNATGIAPDEPVFKGRELRKAAEEAMAFAAPMGAVQTPMAMRAAHVAGKLERDNAERAAGVLAELAKMDSPTAKAAPEAVADWLAHESKKLGGAPIDAVHVDAKAFVRLFQSERKAQEAATELLGENGPRLLRDAVSSGSKIEVPMATYLGKWGGTEVAVALADDVSATAHGKTRNEYRAEDESFKKMLGEQQKDIEKEIDGGVAPLSKLEQLLLQAEESLPQVGGMTKGQAKTSLTPVRAFMRAQAAREGKTVDELFGHYRFDINVGEDGRAVLSVSDAAEPEGDADVDFDFGENEASAARVEEARAAIGRKQDPEFRKLATAWLDFTIGKGERVEVTDEIEKFVALHGFADPEKGFAFDEATGRSLEGRGIPGAGKGGGGGPQAEALFAHRTGRMPRGLGLPNRYEQRVFHGTPHRGIEKFSLQKIGTGEGAQVYGHGMYFAQNREVAEQYRKKLATERGDLGRSDWRLLPPDEESPAAFSARLTPEERSDLFDLEGGIHWHEDPAKWMAWKRELLVDTVKAKEEWIQRYEKEGKKKLADEGRKIRDQAERQLALLDRYKLEARPPKTPGQLYEAEVPEDHELLDYDKPLRDQSMPVLEKLAAAGHISHLAPRWVELVRMLNEPGAMDKMGAEGFIAGQKEFGEMPPGLGGHLERTGAQLYSDLAERFGSARAASDALRIDGIPGLRYRDFGSRGKDDKVTRNIVVWDESRMAVAKTYYQPGFEPRPPPPAVLGLEDKLDRVVPVASVKTDDLPEDPMLGTTAGFQAYSRPRVSRKEETNSDTGWKIRITKKGIDKTASEPTRANLLALHRALPDLIKNAVRVDVSLEEKDRTNIDRHHVFYAPLAIVGVLHRVKLTVREYVKDGRTLYRVSAKEAAIEGAMENPAVSSPTGPGETPGTPQVAPGSVTVRQLLAGVKDQQDRPLLDANGSLIIYPGVRRFPHGTPEAPRGYTDIAEDGPRRLFRIALNKNSDLSTFLHESGHVFLEWFGDLAERADASPAMKRDYEAALAYLGVKSRDEIQREHHEKWARAFEAYLMEGKAPSPALRQAFERMRLWLRRIYASFSALDAPLNDEIRGVFDRLLATEEEIARAQRRSGGMDSLFRNAEEMGVSGEEWQKHLEEQVDATSRATRQAELVALKDRLRATEAWWKDEEKALREQAAVEYDSLPAVTAKAWLTEAKLPADLPVEQAAQLDDVALVLNYPTGAAMLEAIRATPDRKTWAQETAKARMEERHPDILADRTKLREAAEKGVNGDFTAKWLVREWNALRRKNKIGDAPIDAVRRAAKDIVDRRVVGRLNVHAALAAERAAAEKAAKAAARGDYAQAHVFMQQRLLNLYVHRNLVDARELRDGLVERAKKAGKDAARAKMGKASPVYSDGLDSILETLGFAAPRERDTTPTVGEIVALMDEHEATVAFDPTVLTKLLSRGPEETWKTLTVEQLREVDAAVKSIQAAGRDRLRVLVNDKWEDFEDIKAQLITEAVVKSKMPNVDPTVTPEARSALQYAKTKLAGFDADLLKPEVEVRWLGGDDLGSTWYRSIILPLQRAKAKEVDLLRGPVQKILDAFEKMPSKVKGRLNEAIDGRALFPGHATRVAPPVRRFELLAFALNSGNAGNLQRLMEGRNITPQQHREAVDLLTKDELDWVQNVWDAMESLWPEMAALEERHTGLRPEKVEALPLETRYGTYRGGYYPAVYVPRDQVSGIKEDQALASQYTKPGTSKGHLKKRASEYSGAISLSLNAVVSHLSQATHDIAFREPLQSVARLLSDKEIRTTMQDKLGEERTRAFVQWMRDIGTMRAQAATSHAREFNSFISEVRARTVLLVLGYSARTALGDFANLVGVFPGSKWKMNPAHWASALGRYALNPRAARRFAESKSGELRTQTGNIQRELVQTFKKLTTRNPLNNRVFQAIRDNAFVFMEWSSHATSTPLWMAAYDRALSVGKPDEDAVIEADALIRKLFPSHSAVDTAPVIRDKGMLGAYLQFHGYMNVSYNVKRDIAHDLHLAEGFVEKLKASTRVLPTLLAWQSGALVFEQVLSRGGPEHEEGRDRLDEWWEWYKLKLAVSTVQDVPLLGELALLGEAVVAGDQARERSNPVAGVAHAVYRAWQALSSENKETFQKAKALLMSLGIPLNLPVAAPMRAAEYLYNVEEGNVIADDPWDVPLGVIRGEPTEEQKERRRSKKEAAGD